ncbi:MAG TPA: hypothetical protein PLQ67_02930, partial [Burkholderiaceae bacterium]|nr:hypothetical protein [Burkholderiaceae bacterium]
SNYLSRLAALRPGDTLVLAPGHYGADAFGNDNGSARGLPIHGLHGTADQPITIKGMDGQPRPVLWAAQPARFNVIQLVDASFITIKGLEINGRDNFSFGVSAYGAVHDITLEDLYIHGVGGDQQNVGISTTGAYAWNWVIRGNVIEGAGTGMYLGNSEGDSPFVAGVIENNLIVDSIGYNLQVKHQTPWVNPPAGMPTWPTRTIIRHNVFSKANHASMGGMARPNVLVGDQPSSGAGSGNGFEIYGNFFWQNPSESLFQGEGNIAMYNNLMVSAAGSAIRVQRHNGVVRTVRVFNNTIVAGGTGISVHGGVAGSTQRVQGNAVFAASPVVVSGATAAASDNVTDTYANAVSYLNHPLATLGALDLFPKTGQLSGAAVALDGVSAYTDHDRDFNGAARSATMRGAYSGQGVNPGWKPALQVKP